MKTKLSLLLLPALIAFNTISCQSEKSSDTENLQTLALFSLLTMQGDCAVSAAGRNLNTFVTDTTGSNSKSGVIARSATVPVVNHIASLLKIQASVGTTIALTNTKSFGIMYEAASCPLVTSALRSTGDGFALTSGATDSNSEFTGSHKIDGSATITFTRAGTYFYLFYQIPRSNQTGAITYAIVGGG